MEQSSIPNINPESSKSSDVYEINFNVILVGIAVVVILVVGFLFWKSTNSQSKEETLQPTPAVEVTLAPTSTPTSTPSLTPTTTAKSQSSVTPKPTTEISTTPTVKQGVKIQILNGTGVTGDAGFLKTKLISSGFASGNLETGNAESTSENAKTEVVYYSNFPSSLKIDFTSLLNELYASVSASTSADTSKYDVVVTTGKKK
jgi:hypothetical protein